MQSSLDNALSLFSIFRIVLIASLVVLVSGWTCSAMFLSCQGVEPLQATSLAPESISTSAESVLLIVNGTGFTPQSQIMWNGNALHTAFIDQHRLQTEITRATLEFLGSSAGTSAQISVRSQSSLNDMGCPIGGDSATLILIIN